VTIDLEQNQPLAAVRITTHQPNEFFCHADSISIEYSPDGSSYQWYQGIGHDQIWSPPGDYLGWEHDGSSSFTDLPALGRLSFPFWAFASAAVEGRFVRCTFFPQSGRGVGISEIQVLSQVSILDWPDREVFMDDVSAVDPDFGEDGLPEGELFKHSEKPLLQCNPNPFNATTCIQYIVPSSGTVSLSVYDLAGRLVRVLIDEQWHEAREYNIHWDGLDMDGRVMASGTYVCDIVVAGTGDQVKVVIVK